MKILTWNCYSRFKDKAHLVQQIRPDLAIIPECDKRDIDVLNSFGYSALWFGLNERKGVAVFASSPWKIEPLEEREPRNTWIAPISVYGTVDFTLLAVWAWHDTTQRYAGYVDQLIKAFSTNPDWFARGPVVAAGDFNSSARFDKDIRGNNHSSVVSLLENQGLTSAYHHLHGQRQGEETTPTYHHTWNTKKPFHIDYIFIPKEWAKRMKSMDIGPADTWIKYSDHSPLWVEFASLAP